MAEGAYLFYANAGRFAADVCGMVEGGAVPVNCLLLDAGAITSNDYSAGRVLRDLEHELLSRGIPLMLVHAEASLLADLHPHLLHDVIAAEHISDTWHDSRKGLGLRWRY
jgi:MFS superfamily sulfate permease-like transporter